MNLKETFDKFDDHFLKFNHFANKLHRRSDLCAFMLLDLLVPGTNNMIISVEHDEIYLDTDCEKLASVASELDIMNLVQCGVIYDEDHECLKMFV